MRLLLAATLLAALLGAASADYSLEIEQEPDYDLGPQQMEEYGSEMEDEGEEEQEPPQDDNRARSRSGAVKKEKSSSSSASSSSSKVTTTKVNVQAQSAPAVVQAAPTVEKVVKPVVQKVVEQPVVQKVVEQPVVQKVVAQPVVQKVVEKLPQPVVHTMIHKPVVEKVLHQPLINTFQKQHVLPQLTQQHFVQQIGVPQNHIDILPMSSGQYAVAVDDMRGSLVNYLSLDKQIHLVPQEMHGVNQYLLPAQDLVTHKQSLVHLGSPNGHLVLSDLNVGGQLLHGFQGWDNFGEVMVPVHGQGAQMMVEPTSHRISFSSGSSGTSSFASSGKSFAYAHA